MSQYQCNDKVSIVQKLLEEWVVKANQDCGFSQRDTALNAVRYVQVVVLGWLKKGDASLNELAAMAQELGVSVTGAAIHARMNTQAVELLRQVLGHALHDLSTQPRLSLAPLEAFRGVCITDSTQVRLPASLYAPFAGIKGVSQVKLQVTLDYMTGKWLDLELEAGKVPDQTSGLPVRQAWAGSLNLFDLGYFKQEHLQTIAQQQAFFVSRYQTQTALYEWDDETPLRLVERLPASGGDEVELQVRLGGRVKLPLRLVARRLSADRAAARRRKAQKKMKHLGKTCSPAYLALLGWDILITNLPPQPWAPAYLFDLYRIRFQIEWVFRIWKAQLQVDYFGQHWRAERVLCQLYAHLIGILLCHLVTAGWLWKQDHEHSLSKCVTLIQLHLDRLMHCIKRHWYGMRAWLLRLEAAFRAFGRKTKRKKEPSTLQSLMAWSLF